MLKHGDEDRCSLHNFNGLPMAAMRSTMVSLDEQEDAANIVFFGMRFFSVAWLVQYAIKEFLKRYQTEELQHPL